MSVIIAPIAFFNDNLTGWQLLQMCLGLALALSFGYEMLKWWMKS